VIDEVKIIERIMEEKEEEEEDLIELRMINEMVSRWIHKYLKERFRENANKKGIGSYDKSQGRIYAKERQDLPIVKNRERGSTGVCKGPVKEGIYKAIKITTDITSILCAEERWEEKDSVRLSIFKQLDN